jgi:hypothetical protein
MMRNWGNDQRYPIKSALGLDEIFPEAWCSPEPWMSGFPARFWGFLQTSWDSVPRILLFCSRERGPEKIAAGRTITHVAAAQGGHKGWWVERNHMYIVSIWPGRKKTAFLSIYRWFLYTNQAFPRTPKLAAQLLKSAFFVGLCWVPIYFQQILAWPTSISVAWTNAR